MEQTQAPTTTTSSEMSDSEYEDHLKAAMEVLQDLPLRDKNEMIRVLKGYVNDLKENKTHNDPQQTKRLVQKFLERQKKGLTPLLIGSSLLKEHLRLTKNFLTAYRGGIPKTPPLHSLPPLIDFHPHPISS